MLLIYIEKNSSRTDYLLDLLFKHELNIEYAVTLDYTAFESHQQEKINYSASKKKDEFFIKAFPLLCENTIEKREIPVAEKYETKVLFPNDDSCDLGFDIFSAIFYMVSRYEEYLPFSPDKYGRYKASDSLAFQYNFLQTPVVNIWINILKDALQKRFPSLSMRSSTFKSIVTYDIDVAYKFKGRSIGRIIGAMGKDTLNLDLKSLFQRKLTFLHLQKDPWDAYNYLSQIITKNKLDSIFFFLLADKGINDRNLNWRSSAMMHLINKVKTFSRIGIHPSFDSSLVPEKIVTEKERLEEISGKSIRRSRQHFLKFNLPETYQALLNAGITEDYSMGFASTHGFRAGTCKPFYFYDLKNEKATALKIFPVTIMEGTFMNSNISPDEALQQMLDIIKEVKNVGGTFISIWHNHTVSATSEYKAWRHVHDQMIEAIL